MKNNKLVQYVTTTHGLQHEESIASSRFPQKGGEINLIEKCQTGYSRGIALLLEEAPITKRRRHG